MAKKLYIGASTVAHKTKQIYLGSGNVAHRISAGYIGVNGAARKFYPPEVLYHVWNRYTVEYATTYTYTLSDREPSRLNEEGRFRIEYTKSFTFNIYTGKFTISNYTTAWQWSDVDTSSAIYFAGIQSGSHSYLESVNCPPGTYPFLFCYENRYLYRVESYETGEIETAGSFIDEVLSTAYNTYPSNGRSGSYWYIYQGTRYV